ARCVSKSAPRHSVAAPIRQNCGDDAFFLARHPRSQVLVAGIADGVSSWSKQGVDPALFAWELMVHCEAAVLTAAASAEPAAVLTEGYEATVRDGGNLMGSSTACIASLDSRSGRLCVANLGDSGAVLVREGRTRMLETKEQQHYFNCPYQLVCVPLSMRLRMQGGDLPAQSEVYEAQVKTGDLLVLATDGFLDNVWQDQMMEVLAAMHGKPAQDIAQRLVELAYAAAHSMEPSPFGASAWQHGMRHRGGKPDDIAVLVARVIHSPA
ncbi:unnamed protein product, partial [Polarella glacialis]